MLDAPSIAAAFGSGFDVEVVTSTTHSVVEADDLHERLQTLFSDRSADLIVFTFSGHALQRGDRTFFATDEHDGGERGLVDFDVLRKLASAASAQCLLILDCCHAGSLYEGLQIPPNVALIGACAHDQRAESSDHASVFASVLVRCLQRALARGEALSAVGLHDQVRRAFPPAVIQNPVYYERSGPVFHRYELFADENVSPGAALRASLPVTTGPVVPAQLPPMSRVYKGRDEVTVEITEFLRMNTKGAPDGPSIVVVTGPGGMGKTTTALHAAHVVASDFHHGQLYADLNGADQSPRPVDELLGLLLRDLGVPGNGIPDSTDGKTRVLRSALAPLRVLMFLDNAHSDEQVEPLLPGAGASATIITSRQRLLGTYGARIFDLDVLSFGHGAALLSMLVGTERCGRESEAVRRIVTLCSGLPLALAIVGARLASRPHWSLNWFADQLSDEHQRLDLLELGNLTVRTAFALSYRHLHDDLKVLFCFIGLWKGSELKAWLVAALTGGQVGIVARQLEGLVDARLLDCLEPDLDGGARYRLHDLLRDYARELAATRFEPDDRDSALVRVARAYATAVTDGHADVAWLLGERVGLDQAIGTAIEQGMEVETVRLVLARAAATAWPGEWPQWEEHTKRATATARALNDAQAESQLWIDRGRFLREVGRFGSSEKALREALRLRVAEREAAALQCLGDTYRHMGRLFEALECFEAVLSVRAQSAARQRAAALEGYGDAARGLSRWAEAISRLANAIEIHRSVGDEVALAGALCRMAMVHRDRMHFDEATAVLQEALSIAQAVDPRWAALIHRQIGLVDRNAGLYEDARNHLDIAHDAFQSLVDVRSVAMTERNIGDLLRATGDFRSSETFLLSAKQQFVAIGDVRWIGRSDLSLADTYRASGDLVVARELWEQAAKMFDTISDKPAQGRGWRSIALIERDAQRVDAASLAFTNAVEIFLDLGDLGWSSKCFASWSRSDDEAAQEHAQQAATLLVEAGIDASDPWSGVWREW